MTIPFFIPHQGCQNICVFCSQTKITGRACAEQELEDELSELRKTLETALTTISGDTLPELAFFGGSFTGIPRVRMLALLQIGQTYRQSGRISGIRVSTRPDYLSQEIIDILIAYGVETVELGIQSMNDDVLTASARGHTAADSIRGVALIKQNGLKLVGQMMVGLPCSSDLDEYKTAEKLVEMGVDYARIYPTVVFKGTPLYTQTLLGLYKPLTIDEAVCRAAGCLDILEKAGIPVIRIGLHASEELAQAAFGANHPALGELVASYVYTLRLGRIIEEHQLQGCRVLITMPKGEISKLTGHGNYGKQLLEEKYSLHIKDICEGECGRFSPNIERIY